ncbi:uncharacterized protein LOC120352766 [Nilaparvata lugens]|uniref:uncharacterized protein LOC120352766 n=1 Tax=Nilaparvata lugens TaxID=108931 RepID=UPI00193EBA8D|nr:uncharacterized protein LOC120352766 [Nilaparvata lugens]
MINDLDNNGSTLLFANDTSLLSSGVDLQHVLELLAEHLQSSTSWFQANRFQLNENKTQNIICSLSRSLPAEQDPVKLLGFVLDSKLNWASHIQQVTRRLSRICFLLLKLRGHVTEAYLVMIYHALFHCHISYGLLMWGHSARVVEVLKLQKRAARIITASEHRAHCKPLFVRLGIMTVVSHFLLLCLLHVKKNQHGLLTRNDVHHYNTRHRELLDIPRVRLQRSQVCYGSAALRYFNRLPAGVKQLDLRDFERVVTGFMRVRAYYEVREYMSDDLTQILTT